MIFLFSLLRVQVEKYINRLRCAFLLLSMENIIALMDGTENGQLKVCVFAFLNRLDSARTTELETLQECVMRVFKSASASGMVKDWVRLRDAV